MEADPIAFRTSKQLSRIYHSRTKRLPRTKAPTLIPIFSPHSAWFDTIKAAGIRANLCALNASGPLHSQLTPDDFTMFLDSGCTLAMTWCKEDFVSPIKAFNTQVNGIGSGLRGKDIGMVEWTFQSTTGKTITCKLTALFAPQMTLRLLPPQQLASENSTSPHNGTWINAERALIFRNGDTIEFPIDKSTNLPTHRGPAGISSFCSYIDTNIYDDAFCAMVGSSAPAPPLLKQNHNILPHNLSAAQAKLLRIHQRRCHESMARIQVLAAQGKENLPQDISKCPIPKCLDCEFFKAKALPISKQGKLGKTAKTPGDFVSADQLIAGTPGIIPFHSGRPSTKCRYTGTRSR